MEARRPEGTRRRQERGRKAGVRPEEGPGPPNEFKYLNYKRCAHGLIHGGAALEKTVVGERAEGDLARARAGALRGPSPPRVGARRWGGGGPRARNRPVRSDKKSGSEKRKPGEGGPAEGESEGRRAGGRGCT